ncbi:hypothetical protein H4R34_003623 [Dimargaris verticillata]|uniref:Ribosome biogenesis protein SLX9 n=1 Tax=Dimargaris verticillata TaxID=2761393 RepID=A0A9W8E8W4_9FUNG|nr:hypothetical protein H4R34_003623 [Dimargaris verticillata]
MPKQTRQRHKLHSSAVSLAKRPLAAPAKAVQDLAPLPSDINPDLLDPNTLLRAAGTAPTSGTQLFLTSLTTSSALSDSRPGASAEPLASKYPASKRDRQKAKREKWLKKLHHAHMAIKEADEQRRNRQKLPVPGATLEPQRMLAFKQSLPAIPPNQISPHTAPTFDSIFATPLSSPKSEANRLPKQRGKRSNKARHQIL